MSCKNNKRIFWIDTETSGTSPELGHQILSLAISVESSNSIVLDTLDIKLKLKPKSIVSLESLSINGIDPYSEEFNNDSYTYENAVSIIESFVLRNSDYRSESVACAFQADFDLKFLDQMFQSQNKLFRSLFDRVVDPYILAKKLTSTNKIKTQFKYNQSKKHHHRSNSLQSIAEALGTKCLFLDAHTALGDVNTMKDSVKKMWEIRYHQSIFSPQCDSRFKELQIYPTIKERL